MPHHFYARLLAYADTLETDFDSIKENRKKQLAGIADYIKRSVSTGEQGRLLFVCTHNSRRSQFAQVWMQTAAWHYRVDNILTYSGGTEATAANERVISALERAGFVISATSRADGNHLYEVDSGSGHDPVLLFSKLFSDPFNPQERFVAIMVCSDADEACPFVYGAEQRTSLPFDDPKQFDGTPSEASQYDISCRQIGVQMFYAMSLVKEL